VNAYLWRQAANIEDLYDNAPDEPTLGEKLDGAQLVRHSKHLAVTFAWYGQHGFNGYLSDGTEVCYWNVVDLGDNPEATAREELEEAIAVEEWDDLPGLL